MTYRDDREALHHRIEKLEQELQDARREGEEHGRDESKARAAALEVKLTEMREDVAKMTEELQVLRGQKPRPPIMPIVVGSASALFIIGLIVLIAVRSGPSPVIVQPATVPPPLVVPTVTAVQPVEPIAPVMVAPPSSPSSPRSTTARWNATATRVEGVPVGVGSTCAVTATITTTDTNAIVRELSVQCGAQSLYRSTDKLEGMSQSSNDARELLGPTDDKSTFTLMYRDIGSRSGERTQVDLDSTKRQATVFRETIPRFRVDLSVPLASVPSTPLSGAEQRLRRTGKVSSVTGTAPVKEGASCVFRAMPNGKRADCTAEVACGSVILWPSGAPAKCTYDASRPINITTGEDPAGRSVALSVDGSTLDVKAKAFGVEIALDQP